MRPKFDIGEVVLLRSESRPEYNGEYTVETVYVGFNGDPFDHQGNGYYFACGNQAYFLSPKIVDEGGVERCWAETALRKKHQPGELSFTDLMSSLSSPKLLTHDKT